MKSNDYKTEAIFISINSYEARSKQRWQTKTLEDSGYTNGTLPSLHLYWKVGELQ